MRSADGWNSVPLRLQICCKLLISFPQGGCPSLALCTQPLRRLTFTKMLAKNRMVIQLELCSKIHTHTHTSQCNMESNSFLLVDFAVFHSLMINTGQRDNLEAFRGPQVLSESSKKYLVYSVKL